MNNKINALIQKKKTCFQAFRNLLVRNMEIRLDFKHDSVFCIRKRLISWDRTFMQTSFYFIKPSYYLIHFF